MNNRDLIGLGIVGCAIIASFFIYECKNRHIPNCHDKIETVQEGIAVECDPGAEASVYTSWQNAGTHALITVQCSCR